MYEIEDISWDANGRLKDGLTRNSRWVFRFIGVTSVILTAVLAGFFVVDRTAFGFQEYLLSSIPLAGGVILAGLNYLLSPRVVIDRQRQEIRHGDDTIAFDEISVVYVTENRQDDSGHPGGVWWYVLEVTDQPGRSWELEAARQPYIVETMRDALVSELQSQGIEAEW